MSQYNDTLQSHNNRLAELTEIIAELPVIESETWTLVLENGTTLSKICDTIKAVET